MPEFIDKTVFVITKSNDVYEIELDADTQEEINLIFSDSSEELIKKTCVPFDGSYIPQEDESLVIKGFVFPNTLRKLNDAFKSSETVDSFHANENNIQNIKSICVGYCESTLNGENFIAAFQRFRNDQHISTKKINLFFDKNTFQRDRRVGISIAKNVDCVLVGSDLIFDSFYFARQIFDLSEYYRTATDADIKKFTQSPALNFKGREMQFIENAKTFVRRKISSITDSGILTRYSAKEIQNIARNHSNIDVIVEDNKIVMPETTDELKVLLSFLDEESWKGAFSDETYISTSKRKISKS